MTEQKYIQQLLEVCCLHQTIDSLHFWGPAYELSCDNSFYEEVRLTVEGAFELVQNEETTYVTPETSEKIVYLITLARRKISSVQLVEPNNLLLTFGSGLKLKVIGDNGPFESWQLKAKAEDDQILIVAGPGEQLSLFK
ncbi:DUF6188 family protein [Solibacillus sp. FSL W7-1436]|uniref:DUF6188 family protein n=1 Tax=Solibacillus sp. FSL W7-1436 TaxID=2921705 RepID=UPI0030F56759